MQLNLPALALKLELVWVGGLSCVSLCTCVTGATSGWSLRVPRATSWPPPVPRQRREQGMGRNGC